MIMFLVKDMPGNGHLNLQVLMGLNFGLLSWKKFGLKFMVHMIELLEDRSLILLETWQEHLESIFKILKMKWAYLQK
jgi:hypothetical protein